MLEYSLLPESFELLRAHSPEGLTLSARIVEPVILIDRIDGRIVALLAAVRMQKGEMRFLTTPTRRHAWVVDELIIRPLPHDAPRILQDFLKESDPDNLSYSEAIQLLRNSGELLRVHSTDGFRTAGKFAAESMPVSLEVPGLCATLFPYQARGVQWMLETINFSGGLILADEMGLGKTIQIIALLLLERPEERSPALILCPTSLIANWERELLRFAPALTVLTHRGPHRTGVYRGLQKTSVVIATYETVTNDISIFSSFEWSWLICDEAQALKNPDSNRRIAVASILRRRAIPMTGTPIENTLTDLWSLADVAVPGLLGTRREFELAYPDLMESAQALRPITEPIILRRRVADVAGELPERINIDLALDLDEQLIDQYLKIRKSTMAKYPVAGALVATLQLQLFCAHPWLRSECRDELDAEEASCENILDTSPLMTPKMDRATALMSEAFLNQKKVIVFALFNRIGELLQNSLGQYDRLFWGAINGSTEQESRQQIVDEFSAHNGPACLVLNPKAAGAGLNITAATIVIHFTPVWNPALEAQASARAHRLGQTVPVTVYRLFYRDTVEAVMIERSVWKSDLANESIPISSRDAQDTVRALDIAPRRTQ
ncbi:MAG: DEAD/DEAH box helicase [Pseudomonadota bacterium]